MIGQERAQGRAGPARILAAIAAPACGFALAGCFGGGGAKPAGTLLGGAAQKLVAGEARVALTPALNKFSARSVLVAKTETRAGIIVHPEPAAATAVEASVTLKRSAEASAADIDDIARKTTKEARARAKVKACAKAGSLTAAKKYATEYVQNQPPPDVEPTMVQTVSSCLQKAFPEQAPAVKAVGQAITRSLVESSDEVSKTDATAQDYADWLVYSASLLEEARVATAAADARVEVSPVETSVDNLLVALLHAHYGRLAVRREDWASAISERQRVLQELATLEVSPALRPSRELLIRSMRTSLASDRKHAECGTCAAPLDRLATAQKQAFAREFDPYLARKYPGRYIQHTAF